MDNDNIQKKAEKLLSELGVPGFIIFGWQKDPGKKDFSVVSSFHEMPVQPAIKGISQVLNQFIQKTL